MASKEDLAARTAELKKRFRNAERSKKTGGFKEHDPLHPGAPVTPAGTGGPEAPGGTGGGGTPRPPRGTGNTGGTVAPEGTGYRSGERVGNVWTKPDGTVRKLKKVWFDPALLAWAQAEAGRRKVSVHDLIAAALAALRGGGSKP